MIENISHKPRGAEKGNRSKIEIMGDILLLCAEHEIRRTHLLYKANLSFEMFKVYTEELSEKGLIEFVQGGGYLKTTERGMEFVENYTRIRELLRYPALEPRTKTKEEISVGRRLISLGMAHDFVSRIKINGDQVRDLLKGMLYLNQRYKELQTD